MKSLFFVLIFITNVHAQDCTFQRDFLSALPVFMGVENTMDFTATGIKVFDRGNGLKTVKLDQETKYSYPSERRETSILKTVLPNTDTVVTSVPRLFDCNIRQVILRKNKIIELTHCSLEGCRSFTKESCEYLNREMVEDKILGTIKASELPNVVRSLEEGLESKLSHIYGENTVFRIETQKLIKDSARGLGTILNYRSYLPKEGSLDLMTTFEVIGHLAEEKKYCAKLLIENGFYKEDFRPSKYLPKKAE